MPNLQRKDNLNNSIVLEEKCGIVTLFLPNEKFSKQLLIGRSAAGAVQHRGQLGVGIAYLYKDKIKRYVNNGLVLDVLTNSFLEKLPVPKNNCWIQIHCRYGTAGGYDKRNLQPSIAKSPEDEEVSVIHNGQFTAINQLRNRVTKLTNENYPDDISDTYLFTKLLAYSKGNDWGEKLINALSVVNWAYSLIICTNKSVFVTR